MNLGDPELELIDPTPNIHTLFVHFDKIFFGTKLAGRALVRWSKRMYSCAGVCAYEGSYGICDIALSEPLLKLRPRKDLVETLLHEMIHAFLFITNKDDNRDGHGPNFLSHMHRINKQAGLNISVYHDFHDEVKLYQTHWWRCNGPCKNARPYFGIVRRSSNRAPGPSDFWWTAHQRHCGGTFVKIKEPDHKKPKKQIKKPNADITKYINKTNVKSINDIKGSNTQNIINSFPKSIVVNKVNTKSFESPIKSLKTIENGKLTGRSRTSSDNVIETVRNVWANKQVATNKIEITNKRHSTDATESVPKKIKKIDDYFKTTASNILKDVYGEDFKLIESNDKLKLIKRNLVDCPVCNNKVDREQINSHIDECLNKDVIEKITKENIPVILIDCENNLQKLVQTKPEIFGFKDKTDLDCRSITNLVEKIDSKAKTDNGIKIESVKVEAGPSNENQICPCCGKNISKPIQEHLDECGVFSNLTFEEPMSDNTVIVLDEDDQFDETQTLNATGTKSPCPCCLQMVENADMNTHLDTCLS